MFKWYDLCEMTPIQLTSVYFGDREILGAHVPACLAKKLADRAGLKQGDFQVQFKGSGAEWVQGGVSHPFTYPVELSQKIRKILVNKGLLPGYEETLVCQEKLRRGLSPIAEAGTMIQGAVPMGRSSPLAQHMLQLFGSIGGAMGIVFGVFNLMSGHTEVSFAEHFKDDEGVRRGRARLYAGLFMLLGSFFYAGGGTLPLFNGPLFAPFTSIFGVTALTQFGVASLITLGVLIAGLRRCKTFQNEIELYKEGDVWTDKGLLGAFRMIKGEATSPAGLFRLRRRTGASFVISLQKMEGDQDVASLQSFVNQALELNASKTALFASGIFSVLAGFTALMLGQFGKGGVVPLILSGSALSLGVGLFFLKWLKEKEIKESLST
jgi:hypothetical protein